MSFLGVCASCSFGDFSGCLQGFGLFGYFFVALGVCDNFGLFGVLSTLFSFDLLDLFNCFCALRRMFKVFLVHLVFGAF
jgi:hypothetical protein